MQSLTDILWSLGPWNWLILAVALFILETIIPGVHFLWFGVAAVLVAMLAFATDIAWQWQLIAFAITAMATVFVMRRYAHPANAKSDLPNLNVRGAQYIGREVIVDTPIVGGRGKVRVGDTVWPAEGEDADAGARVTVTGVNGTVLVVANDGEA